MFVAGPKAHGLYLPLMSAPPSRPPVPAESGRVPAGCGATQTEVVGGLTHAEQSQRPASDRTKQIQAGQFRGPTREDATRARLS